MRAYVFTDGALAKHAGRFVWLSINTEKPTAEAFLERFPMDSWPTLFVIDPVTEKAELQWLGSASVPQLEKLLGEGEFAVRRAWEKGGGGLATTEDRMAAADHLDADGQHGEAAQQYAALLREVPPQWPRRGRLAESLINALFAARDFETCAARAREVVPGLPRGPSFANAASIGLTCATEAPDSAAWKKDAVAALEPLAREAAAVPGLLADDRSGLYELLVEVKEAAGDKVSAKTLAQEWWVFLDAEAARAQTPESRAAFDPHRLLAAKALGDPARVIPALQATERDLPEDYNAPARLALVYEDLGRYAEALGANGRALTKVYGPRKLRVLEVEATLYQKKGEPQAAQKTLQDALAFAQTLPKAQRPEALVKRLGAQLEALQKGAPHP